VLRSEWLNQQIHELRQIVEFEDHPLWRRFIAEVVEPAEKKAFEAFLGAPAENTHQVIEAQLCGKFAREFKKWPASHRRKAEEYLDELNEITSKRLEDYPMEVKKAE